MFVSPNHSDALLVIVNLSGATVAGDLTVMDKQDFSDIKYLTSDGEWITATLPDKIELEGWAASVWRWTYE